MDKTWISKPRTSLAYLNGVEQFLDFAFAKSAEGEEILCPCVKCINNSWLERNVVHEHLICRGFDEKYTDWVFHGEGLLSSGDSDNETNEHFNQNINDDIQGLLHDAFIGDRKGTSGAIGKGIREGPDDNAKKFFNLLKNAEEELYPGCQNFSVLSFIIRLYLIKCINGWSIASFNSLLTTLLEAFPFAKIPENFNKVKNMVKDLGLDYQKIDACPNNCVLFRKQYEREDVCPKCGASRWNANKDSSNVNDDGEESILEGKKIPAKILRYFPLIPRLQRLFMSSKTASFMNWHHAERDKDGKLRHAADGQAWKDFDQLHPEFASDHRNVRLGLVSDGFNPFRTMSISHSTWPVLMMVYNLPPWMYMKSEYIMLCLLIPGPHSPGINIDVYLEPLIEELKILWDVGIATYYASTNETFQMHAALLWTISDFPAYAMLSGWSTKGKLACPCCNYDTCSQYLRHSKKMCYMGHRRFLDTNHKWRYDKSSFDGTIEHRPPPQPLSGTVVKEQMSELFSEENQGKKHKEKSPWKKKSTFFELPYWETNSLRHNLDVMHIEKNICDNILGTLLDIPGKTKDHAKARFDLKEMGIRRKLQPHESSDSRKTILPKACFSLTNEEKDVFCEVLKNVKLPDGCASNISRCVQLKERKISGYKSHDAHFILHYLLKVAVRRTVPKPVGVVLIRLSDFFKCLCSKVIELEDLDRLEGEIVETLCQLERIFPPSFFDIMVHLPIHLANEARLGGPVVGRWMYPPERFLCKLKSNVGNRSRPEGSIAEAYLAEECLNFCSRYLNENVDTRFNRPSRNFEEAIVNEAPPKKRTRGPTTCKAIHVRTLEEREEIILNENGQPVGDDKICDGFSRFLGTLARNSKFAPLIYTTWRHVPTKKKESLWKYVNAKYIVPNEGKEWVFHTVKDSWRGYKSRLKKKILGNYHTREERLANRPANVPQDHFVALLDYWELQDVKETSIKNQENRSKQKNMHRAGLKSFARIREKLMVSNEDNEPPSQIEMFIATRKPKEGKELDANTTEKLSQLEEIQLQTQGQSNLANEKFNEVMGNERGGRLRLYGRGVTQKGLKKNVMDGSTQKVQQEQVNTKIKKAEEDLQKKLDQHKSELAVGLQSALTALQQCNPSLIIPSGMFDFLLSAQSPSDAGSAPHGTQEHVPTSSAMHNPSQDDGQRGNEENFDD